MSQGGTDKRPRYSRGGLGIRFAFGACLGTCTGIMLGVMDAFGLGQMGTGAATTAAKVARKFRPQESKVSVIARSGVMFGVFGALYQGTRHAVDKTTGRSNPGNAAIAASLSLLPFAKVILQRRFNLFYALGIVVFDEINDYQKAKELEDYNLD
mmetsp:Transcript_16819/g.23472  ORF Transcript_16819/g.23472 Transcript_16819/m.23472 type:complete len:154 (-) Transcript_16819:153-614(-)